ncbi:MAG: hypothetical protein R3190_02970 [Thermoanaerobaculia bacterium]|nr:hypothetical protein [Thermoanaerobaculia bacterium]
MRGQTTCRAAALLVAAVGMLACEPTPQQEGAEPVAVPPDLMPEIINPNRPDALRCSPDLRIAYKVSRGVLEAVVRDLLDGELDGCDFGIATFYLPHMDPGGGAWAIAELSPTVVASIIGLRPAEEKRLVEEARSVPSLVGTWIDDTSYAAVINVVSGGGSLFVERRYRGGDVAREEVVFGRYGGRVGFEEKERNDLGRYYIVDRNGNLETHDDHGRLNEARLYRLDRDFDGLIVAERDRERERIRIAAARAESAVEARSQRRLDEWRSWLKVYRESVEPIRHPILRLAASEDGVNRERSCRELASGLAAVPTTVRAVPNAAIDIDALERALSRVNEACGAQRWVQVLVESRSAVAYWREIDRTLQLLAQQYRAL